LQGDNGGVGSTTTPFFFGIGTDCPEVTGNSGQAHTPEKLFQNIKWRNPNTKLWMRFAQSLITGHMRLPWKAFIV
jgi:hypothetical protein